ISAVTLAMLYALADRRPTLARSWSDVAHTALEFSTLAAGPSAASFWPYSGLAIGAALAASAALLVAVSLREPSERIRAWGLLCFLAAMTSLAIAIGWGRTGTIRLAGFADRYVTLAVPLLCGVSLSWQVYGGALWSRLLPTLL